MMMMDRALIVGVALVLVVGIAGAQQPEKIMTGYSGAFIGHEHEPWRDFIPLLADNGFNACDLKLHPANFDTSTDEFGEFASRVANAVDEAGLDFYAYLYDAGAKRNPDNPAGPAFVDTDGVTNETMYCLYQTETWMMLFERVFYLAEWSLRAPITGVKIDIEHLHGRQLCMCDHCFGSFANAPDVPPAERWAWVEAHGGAEAYEAHLEDLMDQVVRAYEARAHAINPDLRLGVMPIGDDFFHRPWVRYLATERAPAVIDSWPMYSGLGYTDDVGAEYDFVKSLNPHNLYVPWFRINRYRPEDMGAHALVATVKCDGYNMWTIGMIHPSVVEKPRGGGYALPVGYEDPMPYWAELGRANARIREWMTNPTEISYEPIDLLVAGIDTESLVFPDLRPVATDAVPLAEAPGLTGLRGKNTLFIYVSDPAEPIIVHVRHRAGKQRPEPIAWALADDTGMALHEGQVAPGKTGELSLRVMRPGTYALALQATQGGGAWYGVRVVSHPHGVDASAKAYYFRALPRQYFYVPEGLNEFEVRAETGGGHQAMMVRVWRPDGEAALEHMVNAEVAPRETLKITVPEGMDGSVWSLWVGKPEVMPATHYSENYWVRIVGASPWLADRPDAVVRGDVQP